MATGSKPSDEYYLLDGLLNDADLEDEGAVSAEAEQDASIQKAKSDDFEI